MPGTSPRRSSRARISQPPHSASNASSTTSSVTSARTDRNTRAGNKVTPPLKSTPSGSPSSEGLEEPVATTVQDSTHSRRKKRGQANDTEKASTAKKQQQQQQQQQHAIDVPNSMEEPADDDEAVRCVCGYDDYPGPPPPGDEDSKHAVKHGAGDAPITDAELTDDLAGFFLQCDVCKVWQHGACVGIKSETSAPEEYFCEMCRKDLHRLSAATNGQRYSQYLPLSHAQSRTSSRANSFSKDGTRSPRGGSKNGRPSSAVQSAKRRSTMNSRDAAYDEEEQLRQAIEASKGEDISESVDGGPKNGKRGRSDSEEKPGSTKRQRTSSNSSSNPPHFPSQLDEDEPHNPRGGGLKKIRGAAARNHKEKVDREEKEKMRKEAANNRQSRLERRKVEEPSEEIIPPPPSRGSKASKASTEPQDAPPSAKASAAESPPPIPPPPASHRKGGRPPNTRKGKLGRNQYSKDREAPDPDAHSPVAGGARSQSRDTARQDDSHPRNGTATNTTHTAANTATANDGGNSTNRPSAKAKNIISHKISWPELRRRVDSYLTFIAQTQIEMAQDPSFLKRGSGGGGGERHGAAMKEVLQGMAGHLGIVGAATVAGAGGGGERDFQELSVVEMMDHLTREMIRWQKDFAA